MAHPREIRVLALQMLYQLDARGGGEPEIIRRSLLEAAQDLTGHYEGAWAVQTLTDPRDHEKAFNKALGAWESRDQADQLASRLAPDWPTHRQPAMDRNVIRLCWYEMTQTDVPPKVAVNEAIELAKKFGTGKSAPFLNGVLDRMLKYVLAKSVDGSDPGDIEAATESLPDGADPLQIDSPLGEPEEHTEFWSSDQ